MAKKGYEEYVWRKGAGNQRALHKSLYLIAEHGVRGFDINELKQIGRPIIREVKIRMRELEESGMAEYSKAYRFMIDNKLKVSLAGRNINQIKHELKEAYNFLHTKTSTVEGTVEYKKWLDRTLGGDVTEDNAKWIWGLVHMFERTNPEKFINYGYDEAIKTISKVAKRVGYDPTETEKMVREIFEQNLHFEDEEDIPRERDFSPWFKRGSSMTDF